MEYLKLENEHSVENDLQRDMTLCREERALSAQRTETHASSTSIIGLRTSPSHSIVTIDVDPFVEEGISSPADLKTDFSSSSSSSWRVNPSSKAIHKAARFIYDSKFNNMDLESSEQREKSFSDSEFRHRSSTHHGNDKDSLKESETRLKYDILDYYERYSPTTAKTLIDTLLLSRKEVCKLCAQFKHSPVYSDRLVYGKRFLYAREIMMSQFGDSIIFESAKSSDCLTFSQLCDYMPVCNLEKPNVSGIFYFSGTQDVFDLKSSLQPEILIENSEFSGIVNTQIYHCRERNSCSRISENRRRPMSFQLNQDILTNFKSFGFNSDIHNWDDFRHQVKMENFKDKNSIAGSRPNRASLLLLEPLIMPSFSQGKKNFSNINHADNLSLMKIVIAYTLAFFIVTTITFYVVYLT